MPQPPDPLNPAQRERVSRFMSTLPWTRNGFYYEEEIEPLKEGAAHLRIRYGVQEPDDQANAWQTTIDVKLSADGELSAWNNSSEDS